MSSRLRSFGPTARAGSLLALLLAAYVATSLYVLRESAGLPYISDNVESYSSLVHAKNLYRRGLAGSLGLTDETYGARPDAPTVVYTHQGNFPRFYALLLYVLGLDTVERQILATLATVGIATVILAFVALARLTTAGFAFLAVLLLQTNYVYVVQWNFDTFRAWHGLLLFSTLLLACRSTTRTPLWLILCATNFVVCFYFETIFALFLSLLYLCVSALVGKRDLADQARAACPLALGACLGGGVLVLQDIAYLGWEGFLKDLHYTYRIRNYSNPEYASQLDSLESFYREHSVVYWYINIQDTSRLLRPAALVRTHMAWIAALLPPVLIFAVAISAACWGMRMASSYASFRALLNNLGKQKHFKTWTLPEIQALLVATGMATGLILPLVAIVVFFYPMAGRAWPFLFLAFLPLTLIGFRITTRPLAVSKWMHEICAGTGREFGRPFRLATLTALVLLAAPSLVLLRTAPGLQGSGVWAPAALWLSRLVAFGTLVLLGIAAYRLALFMRLLDSWSRLQHAHRERTISRCGVVALLIGLCGLAFAAQANQWIPVEWLPISAVTAIAITYATYRFAVRPSSAAEATRAVEHSTVTNERLLFHCLAALFMSPLLVLALAPALARNPGIFTFGQLFFVFALLLLLVVILRQYLRLTAALPAISIPQAAVALRVVASQWLLLFVLGLPAVLLHVSPDANVVGRYSHSYTLLIAVYGIYMVSFALIWLLSARFLGFLRNARAMWVAFKRSAAVLRLSSPLALFPGALRRLIPARKMWPAFKPAVVVLLLAGPLTLLLEALWSLLNLASSTDPSASSAIVIAGCASAALAAVLAVTWLASGRARGYADLSLAKVSLVAALMCTAYLACARYSALFGRPAVDIWKEMPANSFAPHLYWVASVVSIVLALTIALKRDQGVSGAQVPKELRRIGMLIAACTLSYGVVFFFSPGYVFSAYLARWAIFPSFLWLLFVSATIYSFFRAGSFLATGTLRNAKCGLSWVGGALAILMVAVYGATQLWLLRVLPADHYSFLPTLGTAPYKGRSFVIDNYAAPVTAYTDEWAYYDPRFANGELTLEADGFKVGRDTRHLWSRDQLENPAYQKPDYFLCMQPQTPVDTAILKNVRGEPFGCSSYPLAMHALAGDDEVLAHRIQDRDHARDSWMIIKLDWTYPPYLREDPATGKWLEVAGKRRGGRTELEISYQYEHQDGLPEQQSILRVYHSPTSSSCALDHRDRVVVASSTGGTSIALPSRIRGTIVVSVTPMAAGKYGAEYFSEEITIPSKDFAEVGHCPHRNAPTNILNVLARTRAGYLSAYWNAVDYATEYVAELRTKNGSWFSAGVVSLPRLVFELPDAKAEYEMRVLPCNGRVCGGYSRPKRVIPDPPVR